jgi:predicted nucleotidyltransferase component of viral defense system
MLTKAQLARIAQRHQISLATVERDYLQVMFLYLLYTQTQDLILKGGTCLRMVYRSNRYSDDLDFNTRGPVEAVRQILQQTTRALLRFGVQATATNEWVSQQGYAFHLSFKGPLADERVITWGGVDIDVSLREDDLATPPVRTFLSATTWGYDDIPSFTLTHLSRRDIFAEKVRAFFERKRPAPRDLYDLWLLLQSGEAVDLGLINRKMARLHQTFDYGEFARIIAALGDAWDQDLRHLLPALPPFEQVSQQVLERFRQ